MPRTRDPQYDGKALALIRQAQKSNGQWLIFRIPGGYEDRLTLQRAIYYLGANPTNPSGSLGLSIQVQWKAPEGDWVKLTTPRGGPGTTGTPVGRIRIFSKTAGQRHARAEIAAGRAVYDTLHTA
jgi:hypothetical protein